MQNLITILKIYLLEEVFFNFDEAYNFIYRHKNNKKFIEYSQDKLIELLEDFYTKDFVVKVTKYKNPFIKHDIEGYYFSLNPCTKRGVEILKKYKLPKNLFFSFSHAGHAINFHVNAIKEDYLVDRYDEFFYASPGQTCRRSCYGNTNDPLLMGGFVYQ